MMLRTQKKTDGILHSLDKMQVLIQLVLLLERKNQTMFTTQLKEFYKQIKTTLYIESGKF